jgi:hypothetical protein
VPAPEPEAKPEPAIEDVLAKLGLNNAETEGRRQVELFKPMCLKPPGNKTVIECLQYIQVWLSNPICTTTTRRLPSRARKRPRPW